MEERIFFGWIDDERTQARLRASSGKGTIRAGTIAKLFKPEPSYFKRGGRKFASSLPTVFEHEFVMCIEGADWMVPDTPDCACTNCFLPLRSPQSGQSNLISHTDKCWGDDTAYCEARKLDVRPGDGRSRQVDGSGKVAMDFETALPLHIEASRWIATSGRAPYILKDDGLRGLVFHATSLAAEKRRCCRPGRCKRHSRNRRN